MALSKITSKSIEDGIISADDLAAGSISTAKIADSAITLAKLSATGTANSGTFLRGDNTFAAAGLAWQAVVVADGSTQTTGVAGRGYFINTTSAAHTFVLPSSPQF